MEHQEALMEHQVAVMEYQKPSWIAMLDGNVMEYQETCEERHESL